LHVDQRGGGVSTADGSKPVGFKCEKYGKSFPKISGLRTHEGKWCKLRYAAPTAPPSVAPVKGAGNLPPASAEPAMPHDPATELHVTRHLSDELLRSG
jgi:hypothetical protein